MAQFIGEFRCKIDDKGRISLPARLRSQIPAGAENGMIINRGFEKCLVLYTRTDWEQETSKLLVLNEFNRQARKFIRQYNNGANLVNIDGAARVLIPKTLQEYGELKDNVVISAYGNKIEIWSEAQYDQEMEFNADDFASMAEQLLGQTDKKNNSENDE